MKRFFLLLLLPFSVYGQKDYSAVLEKYMQAQVSVNEFSGCVLIMKDGQPPIKKAYGLADRRSNTANTIDTKFRIGSVTKQFTAAAILILEEQGKLSVNDKLSKYFPTFPNGDSISLHLLLCHRSGIGDYSEDEALDTLIKHSRTKEFMIEYIRKLSPDFLPNSNYKYSNSNYYLLGCVIEKVSGNNFREFVRQNILNPLEMKNTAVEQIEELTDNKAKGYQRKGNEFIKEEYYALDVLFSAGAMYSTVEDLYKWNDFSLRKILSKESIKKMYTPYTLNNTHYGYGAVIDTFQNNLRIWHSGGGWAFNANISNYPLNDMCVIVLSNNQGNSEGIANALSAIMFGADVIPPYIHKQYFMDYKDYSGFIGTWIGEKNGVKSEMEIFYKDNELYRRALNAADVKLILESKTKFYYADGSDKQIEFVFNKKGKVEYAWFIKDGIKYKREKVKKL